MDLDAIDRLMATEVMGWEYLEDEKDPVGYYRSDCNPCQEGKSSRHFLFV